MIVLILLKEIECVVFKLVVIGNYLKVKKKFGKWKDKIFVFLYLIV